MRLVAILCLAALAAMGAIDGTVNNKTTGKPQPGATVTLYKLGGGGMESLESVKSGAEGRFAFTQAVQGPALIQTAFDGVTYNHQLMPGAPSSGLQLDVYNSSKEPGKAQVAQHLVLLEPTGEQLRVSETFFFRNDGVTAYNDPDRGTLRFTVPDAAKATTRINATAPQGMPVQRAAEPAGPPGVYKLDFPIKPGETRVDITYTLPFTSPGEFSGRVFHKGPTRLFVPDGVTLEGDVTGLGQEERTKMGQYELAKAVYTLKIAGTGSLHDAAAAAGGEDAGPQIRQILPPRFEDNQVLIMVTALAALAIGFVLLYRKGSAAQRG
jgi:hypothetical protein